MYQNFDPSCIMSRSAKDLISKLLVVDPSKRLTAEAALRHPWIDAPLQNDATLHLTKENMRRMQRKRKFKVWSKD